MIILTLDLSIDRIKLVLKFVFQILPILKNTLNTS